MPPVENAPLVERLSQIRDFETNELVLVDKNCELDRNLGDLKEWYEKFGFKCPTSSEENAENTEVKAW